MGSRGMNLMRARIKGMLVRRRGRVVGIKALIVFLLILLISILIIMFIMVTDSEEEEVKEIGDIYIPYEYLKKAYTKANEEGISFSRLLTYSAFEANFVPDEYRDRVLSSSLEIIRDRGKMNKYQKNLYNIYSKVFDDLKVGPIPEKKKIYRWNDKEKIWKQEDIVHYNYTSTNDFGAVRTYGGDRTHEGNDLIADMGTPIVSMTDGEITRLGWNEYGGQRIGITSNKGTYFYYAHMDSYADGMIKGKRVEAGEVIGYIGDTGYGPPGTRGKLVPHLHIQIGYKKGGFSKEYSWFNPYDIVKFLDDYRVTLVEKNQ